MQKNNQQQIKDLIKLAQGGDKQALSRLYPLFKQARQRTYYKYANKGVMNDDVNQSVELSFLEGVMMYDEERFDNPYVYILLKMRNDILGFYRKEMGYNSKFGRMILTDRDDLLEPKRSSDEELREREEMDGKAMLNEGFESLSKHDMQLVHWYFYDRLTLKQIADKFGVSHQRIHFRLKQIIRKLQIIMN